MKNLKLEKETIKSNVSGITLISLVVTIIVLIILATVSIRMLLGNNGILTIAKDSKDIFNISEIKEKAELVKMELYIDSNSNKKGSNQIKKTSLLNAIKEEFNNSTLSGNKVTTSDNKYDILVDNELNITVLKHTNKKITLSYDVKETETTEMILEVYPVVKIEKEIPKYEDYAQEILDGLSSNPTNRQKQLENLFIEADKYYFISMEEEYGNLTQESIEEIENITTLKEWTNYSYGYEMTTLKEVFEYNGVDTDNKSEEDILKEFMLIKPKQYAAQYGKELTISCNGESKKINTEETSKVTFTIISSGEYLIEATDNAGNTASVIATIQNPKEEKFSDKYTSNTTEIIDGCEVTIPAGFAKGISENVGHIETGLVITDSVDENGHSNGNEFVWIPVGDIPTSNGNKHIELNRYTFTEDGTPIEQNDNTITYTTIINKKEITNDYKEEEVAKDIDAFKISVSKNGGYYISRHSKFVGTSGKQEYCIEQCKNMYNSNNFTVNLINSYAYDTAIVYIQNCSEHSNFSNKNSSFVFSDSKEKRFCNIYSFSRAFCMTTESPYVLRGASDYESNTVVSTRYTLNNDVSTVLSWSTVYIPIIYIN